MLIDESPQEMRDELQASLAHLDPLLVGLRNFQRLGLSEEARAEVDRVLSDHDHRRSNIATVLTAIDALEASVGVLMSTGYPVLNKEPISPAVREEIAALLAALSGAFGEFSRQNDKAAVVKVDLGQPQQKPKGK